jgi:hypothetical protein
MMRRGLLLVISALAIGCIAYALMYVIAITVAIAPRFRRPNVEHPPIYPSAQQVTRSEGTVEINRRYIEITFRTNDTPIDVLLFYDRSLQEDGWLRTGSDWRTPSPTLTYTLEKYWYRPPHGEPYKLQLDAYPAPNHQTAGKLRVTMARPSTP